MIVYPKLKAKAPYRQRLEVFKGYNRSLRTGSGEFCEMENLTSDDYPVLSTRNKRGRYLYSLQDGGRATGMLFVPGTGLFIAVEHLDPQQQESKLLMCTLFLMDANGQISCVSSSLSTGPKSLALMGKYLIIAPDMMWIDTDSLHMGTISQSKELREGTLKLSLYMPDGTALHNGYQGIDPPTDPERYSHWIDTNSQPPLVKRYSASQQEWVTVERTHVVLESDALEGHGFQTDDAICITGLTGQAASLNGLRIVQELPQRNMIVLDGAITAVITHPCQDYPVRLERSVPKMDFITECGNRLWGCAETTNEIYACKLGDFKNWNFFQKLSTDSWVGNVGTPGAFTGATVQNGSPIFYKEHCRHKVWPSATGAHQITTVQCDGVEKDSQSSLAVCDGTVFYKSAHGVFADDGDGAVEIGQALGDIPYRNGMGAVHDRKYYLSVEDSAGNRHLFVYDIVRSLWHRENGIRGMLCSAWNSLYGADEEIWDLTGHTGTPEDAVSWKAVTGDLGLELPEQKYISRLTLRLCLEPGATLEIYAQYDREQTWERLGQLYGTDLRSFSLPLRPRRCDQLRLKLQGTGMCKIYSITQTLEKGSELT